VVAASSVEGRGDAEKMVRMVADDRENTGGVIAELRRRSVVVIAVRRLAMGIFSWKTTARSNARPCGISRLR
jgi:hypothetical protein